MTALVFGAVSMAAVHRRDLYPSLKTGPQRVDAGRETRGRELLVSGQIALTVVLIVATGLLLRGFDTILRIDPGFDQRQLLTLRVAPAHRAS